MASNSELAEIKKWKKKAFKMSYERNDSTISLLASSFEAVEQAAFPSYEEKQICLLHEVLKGQVTLVSMNEDRELYLLRPIVLEVVECILRSLKSKKYKDVSFNLRRLEKELHDCEDRNEKCNEVCALSGGLIECFNLMVQLQGENNNEDPSDLMSDSETFDSAVADSFSNLTMVDDSVDKDENLTDYLTDSPKGSTNNEEEKMKRPRRNVSKPRKYADFVKDSDVDSESDNMRSISKSQKKSYKESSESKTEDNIESMEDSDEDSESRVDAFVSQKKTKESGNGSQERNSKSSGKNRVTKKNDTELECPECEYRSLCVQGWIAHLKIKHSTNPTLAGLALRCKCGNESFSAGHARSCDVAQFTLVRVVRSDEQLTPQCILCEVYPKTPCGYAAHLKTHHNTTMKKNNFYIKCSCGKEMRNKKLTETHGTECDSISFTLHKLEEK